MQKPRFPSQLLQRQAASCAVSSAGPTRNLVFRCQAPRTILHLKKARRGHHRLILSLSIITLCRARNCFPNTFVLSYNGCSLSPTHQTGTSGINEAYPPIPCSRMLRELPNACNDEKYFACANGTLFKDHSESISVSLFHTQYIPRVSFTCMTLLFIIPATKA